MNGDNPNTNRIMSSSNPKPLNNLPINQLPNRSDSIKNTIVNKDDE